MIGGRVGMQGVSSGAARDGAPEFGDVHLDVFQSFGGSVFPVFYPVVVEAEVLGIGVVADFAAVFAADAYIPPACPGKGCREIHVLQVL